MIRPIIEYCVGVWACCGEVNSGHLEALQKRAARVFVKTGSSSDAMASVMWPTLKERRMKHVYNVVNKSLAGRCPQHFINYFSIVRMSVCILHVRANCYICLPFVRKLPKDLFTITVVLCIIILNHIKSLLSLSYYHFLVHTNLIYIF